MKNRITLLIVAVILGAWCILPDPVPFVVDDIVAGLGSAASLIKLIHSCRLTRNCLSPLPRRVAPAGLCHTHQ